MPRIKHNAQLLPWMVSVAGAMRKFRYVVLTKGRRAGGTSFAEEWLLDGMLAGMACASVCVSYRHLAEIWRDMVSALRPIIRRVDKTEHRIELINGGSLDMWSAEADISMRGRHYDRVAVHESAHIRDLKTLWEGEMAATLSDTQGRALFESSPNGHNYHAELHDRGQDPNAFPEWMSYQLPTSVNPTIPASEIDNLREILDESNFRQEIMAEFVVRSGACFPMFSRARHVRECPIDHRLPIHVGIDFGFRHMAMGGFQVTSQGEVHVVFDAEYSECTTEQGLTRFLALPYGNGKPFAASLGTIGCDPAGDARNLQTGRSDVSIVRSMIPDAKVRYSMRDEHRSPEWRTARMRDLLLSASGNIRLFVDPSCKRVIRMFENSVYPEHKEGKEEKQEPVKDGVIDHTRDWLGYGLVNAGVFGEFGARSIR